MRLYFAPGGALSASTPQRSARHDTYTVDFRTSEWHADAISHFTQLGGGDVIYPDRAAEDRKLTGVYDGAPRCRPGGHRITGADAGDDVDDWRGEMVRSTPTWRTSPRPATR